MEKWGNEKEKNVNFLFLVIENISKNVVFFKVLWYKNKVKEIDIKYIKMLK